MDSRLCGNDACERLPRSPDDGFLPLEADRHNAIVLRIQTFDPACIGLHMQIEENLFIRHGFELLSAT